MDYSQFLYMPQELGLLVVFLLVFLFDTFGPKRSQSSLPVLTAVLFGIFTVCNGFMLMRGHSVQRLCLKTLPQLM